MYVVPKATSVKVSETAENTSVLEAGATLGTEYALLGTLKLLGARHVTVIVNVPVVSVAPVLLLMRI